MIPLLRAVKFLLERWIETHPDSGWWNYAREIEVEIVDELSKEEAK